MDRVAGTEQWFGAPRKADVSVVPLQDVMLQTHGEQTLQQSVRIGGAAAVGQRQVLNENRLPAGSYLFVVTLWGEANWDRRVRFVQVAEK